MAGFRGILSGELLEKDIEAGTLSVKVVSVPRVWEKNKANPEALIGRTIRCAVSPANGSMCSSV